MKMELTGEQIKESKVAAEFIKAIFDSISTKTKYIINPAYELSFANGKAEKVAFVTASKGVQRREFGLDKYKKI